MICKSIGCFTLAAFTASGVCLSAGAKEQDRWGAAVDVESYVGLYDDTLGRAWFVAEAEAPLGGDLPVPEGHLMFGATFGDVAPWYLTTLSETEFVRRGFNEYNPDIAITFEFDEDGNATALTYVHGDEPPQTWQRSGDLPQDWQ